MHMMERKESTRESENLYRSLFQNNHSIMLIVDPAAGVVVDANPAACLFYGYGRDELVGKNLSDINILSREKIRLAMARAGDEEQQHFYFQHRLASGEIKDVEVYSGPILRHGRKLLYSIIHDISARKGSENKLRQSEKEWKDTFDAMADIVTIQDRDMRIIKANRAAHDFFKLSPGELTGKLCYEVFRGASVPCPSCPELDSINDLGFHTETIVHENLARIFTVTTAPVLDEKGDFKHIVHIARDITEHKKMEEELLHAYKMEAIGTLAGGIAHDFNNILSAVIGYADLAGGDLPAGSKTRDYIDQVLKASDRAKELVRQILTFSRKNQDTQQLLNPAVIIKEAVKLMHASLPSTIEIREEIDAGCGSIMANPTNIHQLVVNFCTNALHAMEKEQGVLAIRLSRVELSEKDVVNEYGVSPGTFVELMVRDTGHGMDKKTLGRIFEPYFTTKEVGKGTGMGLALCLGIVRNSGGFIKVESTVNKGSTFRVYWPVVPAKATEIKTEENKALPEGHEHILVIDDEETIAGVYRATLESLGYRVTAHCSSEKALGDFRSSPDVFDLIVTDQTMPNLTGAELGRQVLQIRPDLPVILCTGYSSIISKEKAKEIGIRKFIMKPVDIRTLAKAVREVLDAV